MLKDFLEAKPLYYDEIDYKRMPRVYNRIKEYFQLPKIIHLIGTNGKGTTGRFLATALHNRGYDTGHYTSPHILEFNERIWFNGSNVSMQALEEVHQQLLEILSNAEADALSYFEYTTLLAMLYFSKKSDFIILEAGLGGEHDATAVFENEVTLVTPIDKDHEAFLGENIEDIARTKLSAVQKNLIIADQKYRNIYEIVAEIEKEKAVKSYKVTELLDDNDRDKIDMISKKEALPAYLEQNLSLAIAALKYFDITYSEKDFYNSRLFGRLSVLEKNILVDVGHNVLAAQSIVESLADKKYVLVYNSYKDKNYKEILAILKPIVKSVELIDVYNNRVAESQYLQKTLDELNIEYKKFTNIKKEENYLVFGSFSVVEAFLKVYRG